MTTKKHSQSKSQRSSFRTRSGTTAIYVAVFACLLFTIITVGFVTLIMSEVSQTINDELSQSAYDSALAGVEDAKLAIMKCQGNNKDIGACRLIGTNVGEAEAEGGGCKTAATIMDRATEEDGSVKIAESIATDSAEENSQAYTCVTISSNLTDYRSHLSDTDTDTVRVVPLRTIDPSSITGIRISWYSLTDNDKYFYNNVLQRDKKYLAIFPTVYEGISAPPVISVQLIQTASSFTLSPGEIDYTVGDRTDRGTIFLVPTNIDGAGVNNNHISNYGSTSGSIGPTMDQNVQTRSGFLKANDKAKENAPYIIKCESSIGAEFACSATIEVPLPVGNDKTRNSSSSMLVVAMPYDQPATDFAIELCTDTGGYCETTTNFVDAQYAIDSTGRANDVYNRIETRVELADVYFPYPEFAMHLLKNGSNNFIKRFWATLGGAQYSNNLWNGDPSSYGTATPSGGLNGHYNY